MTRHENITIPKIIKNPTPEQRVHLDNMKPKYSITIKEAEEILALIIALGNARSYSEALKQFTIFKIILSM